jgi:glycosyltransferase involved in cell wall biosynthesis
LKILIWSVSPWAKTGYGVYSRELALGLSKHHEVTFFALAGLNYGSIQWGDITVYGNPLLNSHIMVSYCAKLCKPDITLQIFDLWTVYRMENCFLPPRLVTHAPIDSEPLPKWIRGVAQQAAAVIPQSYYGKRVYEAAGIICEEPIYNGINKDIFYPRDKVKSRKRFDLPKDAFIALIVGTNKGDRKNIPNMLESFYHFSKKAKDAILIAWTYPHFDKLNLEGYALRDIWEKIGGKEGIFLTPGPEEYLWGLDEDSLAQLYSAADVLLMCSLGEGFGRPIIEAFACGCPVIGSDNTAITELVKDRGWLVPCHVPYWQQVLSAKQSYPDQEGIVEALKDCYTDTAKRKSFREAGLSFTADLDYKKLVEEKWLPALAKLESPVVDLKQ